MVLGVVYTFYSLIWNQIVEGNTGPNVKRKKKKERMDNEFYQLNEPTQNPPNKEEFTLFEPLFGFLKLPTGLKGREMTD